MPEAVRRCLHAISSQQHADVRQPAASVHAFQRRR